MAEKDKDDNNKKKKSYTIEDAIKIADDIFKMSSEKKYNVGAFIHGLIFAQEYAVKSYKIPQQQVAVIKRDCRKYLSQIDKINKSKK